MAAALVTHVGFYNSSGVVLAVGVLERMELVHCGCLGPVLHPTMHAMHSSSG